MATAWRGALVKAVQELRVHVCQTGAASAGARDFIQQQYAEVKHVNPAFPFLVREASGTEARLTARYDFGVEKSVSIQNDNPEAILNKLKELIKAGEAQAAK